MGSGDVQIINLLRECLLELRKLLQLKVLEHLAQKLPLAENVCNDCLKKCVKKREFTKHLPANYLGTIETKVTVCIKYMYVFLQSYIGSHTIKYFHVA